MENLTSEASMSADPAVVTGSDNVSKRSAVSLKCLYTSSMLRYASAKSPSRSALTPALSPLIANGAKARTYPSV